MQKRGGLTSWRPAPCETVRINQTPALIAVSNDLLFRRFDTCWQLIRCVPSFGDASANASVSLLMRQLCGLNQNFIKSPAVGNLLHGSDSTQISKEPTTLLTGW